MKKRQKIRKGIILFSFFLFPAIFYYLSPVVIIQATMSGVVNGSFIIFLLMFISSLVLGRAYCGWGCPGAGCQEAIFLARDKEVSKGDFVKWFLWVPWICVIAFLAVKNGGYDRLDFFYQTTYGLSIGDVYAFIAYLCVLIILIVLPSFIIGKRSFCHHLCWMAPFMILGSRLGNNLNLPSLHLQADASHCSHCHTCSQNCPMSLPVEMMVQKKEMEHTECILCGTCIDGCDFNVIHFAFSKEGKKAAWQQP